jgi:hypothetical protein
MFPGQPAENSEKLRVGDVIMAANGVPLAGKTSRDAINVLRDQPTRVVLTVKRDPSSIPPSLLRRGSFSQSFDPNEVLSAIHSRLDRDDSHRSAHDNTPGNEESSSREILEPRDVDVMSRDTDVMPRDADEQKSSNAEGILQDKHELPQDTVRTYEDNFGREDRSLDKGKTKMGSGLKNRENGRILKDKIGLSQVDPQTNGGNYGHEDTSLDNGKISRNNSGLLENDSGSQTPTKRLSNTRNMTSENYHRGYDPRADTVEMVGRSPLATSDEKDIFLESEFREGLSSDSMSDDQVIEGGDLSRKFKNMADSTPLVEEDIPSPLENVIISSQTGGGLRHETGMKGMRKTSDDVRTLPSDRQEKLAPPEEVCFIERLRLLSHETD